MWQRVETDLLFASAMQTEPFADNDDLSHQEEKRNLFHFCAACCFTPMACDIGLVHVRVTNYLFMNMYTIYSERFVHISMCTCSNIVLLAQ